MATLFRPWPLPPLPRFPGFMDERQQAELYGGVDDKDRVPLLLGAPSLQRVGEFYGKFYDAACRFQANENSKRWRLNFLLDEHGRVSRFPFSATKEFGYWADVENPNNAESLIDAGESSAAECFRIPMGDGGYRNINVQFSQMAGQLQDIPLYKPTSLITDVTSPLGPVYYSTIQSGVETFAGEGFVRSPPQSHYMDTNPASATFGSWIEPDQQSVLGNVGDFFYWNQSASLRSRLKLGISRIHVWCPSGEYCEFDTGDLEHFKVTQYPNSQAPDVSLPIKSGWEMGTHWEIYLMPRRIQIMVEWWDYYYAVTFFSLFMLGFHNVRNVLTRLPTFPVPYGMVSGQLAGANLVSDWVYYVAQWHGAFDPGIAQAHPRPTGEGIWEGPPVHDADYAVEYAIKHQLLVSHDVHQQEVITPFFAIVYIGSSPVSYFTRLTYQQPGDLVAKIKAKGRLWKSDEEGTFYVWQRALKTDQIQRTLNWGTMLTDFLGGEDFWSLGPAMQLGGWW